MSIELDWQIVEEDVPSEDLAPATPPQPRRRRLLRKWLLALALMLVAAIAAATSYMISTYRQQLERAEREIRPIAKLEAQAIARGDLESFLALQDPEDASWRIMQAGRFGRLEHEGLRELGWVTSGTVPQLGSVSLEPGGARLDVTYHYSITQPMPGGSTGITLRVPQFYKQTPSGWVHANPSAEYWGAWRTHSGKYFAMLYTRRDANVLEPLIPRMDEMLARMCGPLPCPPQPIYVIFENSPDALTRLTDFSYGFDEGSFILKLPSPQLFGVPADAHARNELYRVIGTRIVQALVYEASARRLNLGYLSSQLILRWELAKAGLIGPLITPTMTQTLASSLQAGAWQPLTALTFRSRTLGEEPTDNEVMLASLAFSFLEQHVGAGTVERLTPAMQATVTMGSTISPVLKLNPRSLEPAWLAYLRKQAGLPVARPDPPNGELTLTCMVGRTSFSILRVGADGSNIQVVEGQVQNAPQPAWSPNGKRLAYLRNGRVFVMDADTRKSEMVEMGYPIGTFGWLPGPPERLWVQALGTNRMSSSVVNLDTDEEIEQDGFYPVWSPDGTRVAYSTFEGWTSFIWVADVNGRNAQQIAPGYGPVWSPDSKRVAFLTNPGVGTSAFLLTGEIQIADAATGAVSTLVSTRDLSQLMNGAANIQWTGNLTWSPDGLTLAVSATQPNRLALFAFDANTGAVRARWYGTRNARWFSLAWSADSRHVGFWMLTTAANDIGTVGVLNVTTGQTITSPGRDFDWSPDSNWLAVVQEPDSVFLITPDLSAMRWLETPSCISVAWRPKGH